MSGGILSYFARHRTAANLLLAVLLLLGAAAFPNMRAQFFPDVVIEDISVSIAWEGAGAEDVDAAIIQVIEPALTAIDGVEETQSTAREGRASIELDFAPGTDMTRAVADVETALDAIRTLPEGAEDPEVSQRAWRDRVTDVVLTGPVGTDQLGRFADEFVARLFAAGVTKTTIRGLAAPDVVVEVPSIALVRHDITLRQIADAIAAEAEADPAGDVGGASRLRTGSAKRAPAEIAAIALRSTPDGTTLTVGDVASVTALGADAGRAYFVGANPAISIQVERTAEGDAVGIQRLVEKTAEEMRPTLPEGVSVDLIRTRAEAITERLNILLDNGLMGLALVVTLLFLFLNARTAFWVAAGIPVAMTAAIALMYAAGLTLNIVSLFALIITLGIVVDDAIVVGEHADFRARRLGEDPATAAERAAQRMFLPVFSATITTIIAFFCLVAIGGRFGDLIADIPFTVIVVLAASLVECFLILPRHMAHAIAHTAREHWYDWPSRQVNRGFRVVRERAFRPLMAGVIAFRYPVIAGAVAILASQAALVISGEVQWRFWNAPERGSVTANFAMLPNATRDDTVAQMRALQTAAEELGREYEAEYGRNPIDYVIGEVGGTAGRGLSGADGKDADLLGAISIELIDPELRPYSSFEVVGALQERVERHRLVESLSFRGWRSGPGGEAVDVELSGAETQVLKDAAEALKSALAAFPEVSALEDSLGYDKDELILELTQNGRALGFTTEALGRVLRDRLGGIEAARFPSGPRTAEIRVELPPGELTADFLDRTLVRTDAGAYVPLSDIVTVATRAGFATIRRENGVRVVSVTGDMDADDPGRAAEIQASIREDILPGVEARFGVATRLAGLAEQENRFLRDAATGLILCLAGIYLTLAWVFSSWLRPLVVMAIIPFGLVGAIHGHRVWDVPLSMFSVVGLIGMVGIIINDSIVLVTTIDEKAKRGGLIAAVIDGAADRLRPVLLTTLTTVLGLVPLLFEGSTQAQFLKPSVITLVYGLGFGMVLVLLVVPALIAIGQDIGRSRRAFRRAVVRRGPAGGLVRVAGLAMAGLFAATAGWQAATGTLPPAVAARLPAGMATSGLAALGLLAAGGAAVALLAWAVALTRRRA